MRLMLMAGMTDRLSVEAQYQIQVEAIGGHEGLLATRVPSICPSTMITTSNGTLLLATGYGPMLRMRQNEKTLSSAGVPAPTMPVIIATGTKTDSPKKSITVEFDYTRFGSLRRYLNSGMFGITETDLGKQSQQARQADLQSVLNRIELIAPGEQTVELTNPDGGNPIVVVPNPISRAAFSRRFTLGNYFLATDRVIQAPGGGHFLSWQENWKHLIVRIQITNLGFTSPFIGVQGFGNLTAGAPTYSGRYQSFMRYVDKDYYVSDPSPISADIVLDKEPGIVYTNLEVPTDPRVKRRQIFRNINGESDLFYLDIDTDDLTSTTLVSQKTDDLLKLEYNINVFDDNGYNLIYLYGQPPTDKPYIAEFCGIVYAAGFKFYDEGNVKVVNGSKLINGIGTAWLETFVGRQIVIAGVIYTITDVNETTQVITVDKAYEGQTAAYTNYNIQPYYANANVLNWSETGLPESWPIANALILPEEDDQVTGLTTFANSLWILKNNSIYQFSTTLNPGRDGDYKPATTRGCVNQRCAVQVENVCMMLDRIGIHVFKGYAPRYNYQTDATPEHLSKAVDDIFRFEGTWLRLNWKADKCFWHGVHNKELKTVRWFVTMEGYDYPQHAICYDYLMSKWWIEEYPIPITSSAISATLASLPVLGGYAGKVYQSDRGSLDLIKSGYDKTRFGVVASYAGMSITLDGTPPACTGITAAIVDGTGRGQMRMVLAQSGNDIEVDSPFFPEPDTTSSIQIGAIKYYALSAEYSFPKVVQTETVKAIQIDFRSTSTPLEGFAKVWFDGYRQRIIAVGNTTGALSSVEGDGEYRIDFADNSNIARLNMDNRRERDITRKYTAQLELNGFSGNEKPMISQLVFVGLSLKPDLGV